MPVWTECFTWFNSVLPGLDQCYGLGEVVEVNKYDRKLFCLT